MTRKELIAEADRITNELEEANLAGKFSPVLGEAVHKFEWLVYFEGNPEKPISITPGNGSVAHARLMDSLAFVLAGDRDDS